MATRSDKFKTIGAAMKRHLKGKISTAEVDAFLEKHRPTLERKIREARAGRSERLPNAKGELTIDRPTVRRYNEFEFAERASGFTVDTRKGMWLVVDYKSNLVEAINSDDVSSDDPSWRKVFDMDDADAEVWLLERWPPYKSSKAERVSILYGWNARLMEGGVPVTDWATGIADDKEEAIDDLKLFYNIPYEALVWPTELRIGDMVRFVSPPDWVKVTGLEMGGWRSTVSVDVKHGGDHMERNEQVRVRLPRPESKPPLLAKGFPKLEAPPKQWTMKRDTFKLRADNVVHGDFVVVSQKNVRVVKSRKVDGELVNLTFTNGGVIDQDGEVKKSLAFRPDQELTLLVRAAGVGD